MDNIIDENQTEEIEANKKITKKITEKMITFMICTVAFFLMQVSDKGSFYNDHSARNISALISTIMYVSLAISILSAIVFIGCVSSKTISEFINKQEYKLKKVIFNILDWGLILPICATLASFCFTFLFSFAMVDGTSMMPTVADNERVFVSYLDKIDRFDVIVANITAEDSDLSGFSKPQLQRYPQYYIKRVIGVPGDTLTWKKGVLTINGEVVNEYYFDQDTIDAHLNQYSPEFHGTFKYKENGELKLSTVIPEGYYFVMGDNRGNSTDSRIIGLVKKENIEGVVKFRMGTFFYKGVIK